MAQNRPLNQSEQLSVRRLQFQSNQYLAAFKRQADAKLRAQDGEIRKLTDQLSNSSTRLKGAKTTNATQRKEVEALRAEKAELEKQRDALIAAQLDQVAARDAQFAQDRADIQATVATLLTSPKGAEALEAFNAGDVAAARQIWAVVHQGFSAARQKRVEAEDGAYWRSVAQTLATRLGQGQVTVSDLIEDWEKIPEGAREHWDWIELVRLYRLAGLREKSRDSGNAAIASSKDDRERSVALIVLGDLLENEDRPTALGFYNEARAIRERLAKASPGNFQVQRDLAGAYSRLGDILRYKDRKTALGYYEDAMGIYDHIANLNKSNIQAQHDLAGIYSNIGNILVSENGKAALTYYQDAMGIYDSIAKANPTSVEAQKLLSGSYIRLGDLLVNEDRAAAFGYYRDALSIRERLAKADPSNAQAQRDLLLSLWRMASLTAPDHNWARVKAQLDAMRKANQLMPEDANLARDIDRRAAEEAAKAK